jgi:ABC-type amino acid transport substrate-binding protein
MKNNQIHQAYEKGQGILRMVPNFVPRRFNQAGCRLRLHPDDYYALGVQRGSIKERWFSSVVPALNGDMAPEDEGMSYVATSDRMEDKVLFKDVVGELGADLIGHMLKDQFGTWPMYSKFFDYKLPLFHHLHMDNIAAARVGKLGKPEAYYFPPQMNNYLGEFPVTYFGFDPDVTKEMVRERLLAFDLHDTRLTELSRAYRISLGTGWYTPAGVIHAPGSVLTYEPQWNSDITSVFENVSSGEIFSRQLLDENIPEDQKGSVDYLIGLLDWEKNVDPHYMKHYFRPPIQIPKIDERFSEKWITYATEYFSAKELTVMPGQTVTVKDPVAYGCILIQGHGQFGDYEAEAAIQLRYGQLSADEYFVSEPSAKAGVSISNRSQWEPMVILKHFGPNNPDAPREVIETSK